MIADNGGDAYLFQSVVAVIVGGTVFGGPGEYARTSIGALFLTVLVTVLIGHGASPAQQQIVYGVIILAAVAIYGRERGCATASERCSDFNFLQCARVRYVTPSREKDTSPG